MQKNSQPRRDGLSMDEIRALLVRDDPLILEIGANNGFHTARFLQTFPRARVVSFEPDPRAIKKWHKRMRGRGTLIEAAVGHMDGPITFYTSGGREDEGFEDGFDQAGSIREPTDLARQRWKNVRFEGQIIVPCMRLDSWAATVALPEVDFIWADVQGAEKDLIQGAAKVLSRTRYFYTEYLQAEYYRGQTDLAGIAAMLPNFELIAKFKVDALFRNIAYNDRAEHEAS